MLPLLHFIAPATGYPLPRRQEGPGGPQESPGGCFYIPIHRPARVEASRDRAQRVQDTQRAAAGALNHEDRPGITGLLPILTPFYCGNQSTPPEARERPPEVRRSPGRAFIFPSPARTRQA